MYYSNANTCGDACIAGSVLFFIFLLFMISFCCFLPAYNWDPSRVVVVHKRASTSKTPRGKRKKKTKRSEPESSTEEDSESEEGEEDDEEE